MGRRELFAHSSSEQEAAGEVRIDAALEEVHKSYIDLERSDSAYDDEVARGEEGGPDGGEDGDDKVADVVLSDMSEPWDQTTGFYKRSLSDPYHRMMNTSGISFRDHAGSMVSNFLVGPDVTCGPRC